MIDMTKQYTYKNGEAARILCTDRPFTGNLVVLSMRSNGAIVQSTIDGKSQCYNGEYDLVEVWEPKEEEFVYLWNDYSDYYLVGKYASSDYGHSFRLSNGCTDKSYKYCAPFTGELPETFKGLV